MGDASVHTQEAMTGQRKRRRWWVWTLAGVAAVLVVIIGGGLILLDRYSGDLVRQALADASLPNPRLTVESIGLSQSRMTDIRIGDDDALSAEAIELEYDLVDLIDLEPSDLEIRLVRPTLKIRVDQDGTVSLGSLDSLLEGNGDASGEGALPFKRITLDDATLLIETPEGQVITIASGAIENRQDDGIGFTLTITGDNEIAEFDLDLSATIAPDGAIVAEATVRNLTARSPWGSMRRNAGTLVLNWNGAGLPTGVADMTIGELTVPGELLPPGLTVDGQDLAVFNSQIAATFDGAALTVRLATEASSGDNALSIDLAVDNLFDGGEASVQADLSTSDAPLLWPLDAIWEAHGSLAMSVDGTINLPALAEAIENPASAWQRTDGKLVIQWLLNDGAIPDAGDRISSVGDIEIAFADSRATLTGTAPIELRIGQPDIMLFAGLIAADPLWEPIIVRDLAGSIDLAIEGRASQQLSVSLSQSADGWSVSGEGTVLAATGVGPLVAAELKGDANIGEAFGFRLDDISLFASDIETPIGNVGVLEAAGRFAYQDGVPVFDIAAASSDLVFVEPQLSFPRLAIELAIGPNPSVPGELSGPMTMSFADFEGAIEEVAMSGLSGDLIGRLVWNQGLGQLIFTEDAVFRVESMDIDGDVLLPETSIVRITASENPALELDLNDEAGWSLRHSLDIGPMDIRGSVRMGDDQVQTALTTSRLTMEGGYLEGRYVMEIIVSGVDATMRQRGWTINRATVTIGYDDNDTEDLVLITANAARIHSSETQSNLPPMGTRTQVRYGLDEIVRVTARLFDDRNILIADVSATHDVNTNRGRADVELQDLIFSPGVLQPSSISPVLTDFENVTGTVDVRGGVSWSGSTITPDLAILVTDVTGEFDDVAFTRMNAVVQLEKLDPLRTNPDQLLSIATVDLGIPISNAVVLFTLENGDTLNVDEATFELAGGVVSANNQVISFEADEQSIDLTVTGVDLNTLFEFADLEDLEAAGTLDGAIPIVVVDGEVVIPEAWLSAREPGYIRYDAGEELGGVGESNAGVELMVDLLRNFQYDELDLRLVRPVAGDMQVGFRILGRNPEVYGGIPVDLTLNVDGQLEDVIRNSLDIYRVPEAIQELILQYGLEATGPPG